MRPRLLGLAAALPLALPALVAAETGPVSFSPCRLAHPVMPIAIAARCGRLPVPEDPSLPSGRQLSLRIAVLPADAPRPRPDPVFVLAGGPGQSVTETYPALAGAFARLNRDRDIVLVDQRGTGGSSPLSCPGGGEGERTGDERRRAAECARTLGVDLAQYGTAAFVRDLESVRAALGYERVNLVAFSYGTRAALAYARAYPERARTLLLDGVAPFDMIVGADFDRDSERALSLLFDRCRVEPACRERFGGLDGELRSLLSRLDARPAAVQIAHPVTGEPLEISFDGDALRQVVLAFLYQAETAALLPVLLREAAAGNLAPIAAQGILVSADLQAGLSRPVHLSVLCTEDVPFYVAPDRDAGRGFLGSAARRSLREACAAWPRGSPDPARHEPTPIAVPALLVSGEADPVTPPSWAELAARRLPRSRSITLAGQGHGNLARGCLPRIAAEFVRSGSAKGLDTSCADRLRPAPVFVDLLGGAP